MLLSTTKGDLEKVKVEFQGGYVLMHACKAPCSLWTWGGGGRGKKGLCMVTGSPSATMTQYETFQSRFLFSWMLEGKNPPTAPLANAKDVHTLILGTWEYITLYGKGELSSRWN